MLSIAPDYFDRLGLPRNLSEKELEKLLAQQEARYQVLLKIPVKRTQAAQKLELIKIVKGLLNAAPVVDDTFDALNIEQTELKTPDSFPKKATPKINTELIFETYKITDEGEIGKLRSLINQWAVSIPHHEYLTLGTDIEVLTVEERPIYLIDIRYLLENREVIAKQKPYFGEALPVNAPVKAEQVAVWQVKVAAPATYQSNTLEQEITASRERVDCPTCQRQGEMWCLACRSSGQVACKECQGKYQFNCLVCDGKGQIAQGQRLIDCNQCRGVGIAICGYCREGLAICSTCQGQRRIVCKECSGKSELLNFLNLKVNYQLQTAQTSVFPPNFPDFIQKNFSPTEENMFVFRQEGEQFVNAQPINEIKYLDLRNSILELATKHLVKNASEQIRVSKHSISVRRCPAIYLSYSFEEKEYELWVIGSDKKIYSRTSPISEYDKKLAQLAAEQLAANYFLNALELLSDAFRHTPNSASALVIVNNSVKKLQEKLKTKHFYEIIEAASQAEKFLGKDLAVNFSRLKQQAISNMRREYALASVGSGLLILLFTYIFMGINGQTYARTLTMQISFPLIILATALAWFLAIYLATQMARTVVASLISLVLILVSSIFSLIEQDDYLARRKGEITARFGQGDYESSKAAIEPLESLIAISPKDWQLQLMLGRAYVKATYYEKAVQCLNVALALSNNNAEIYNELGLALLGKNEKQMAIKHFRQAINLRLPTIYREAYQNLARALDMAYIDAATLTMGRSDNVLDSPVHSVIVEGFLIDKFEVTNQEYLEFIKDTKYIAPSNWTGDNPKPGTEKMPVTGISLMDARAFAEWKAKKTSFAYRLPKEAEWELAARGAKGRNFPWGEEWKANLANVKAGEGRLANVGSFSQGNSPEGVADLLGNVAEWIDEPLKVYPNGKAIINAELWVVRGGAYDSLPTQVHGASRSGAVAEKRDYPNIGFRCVISASEIK